MNKILHLSDSPLTNTGYATISRYIMNYLSKEGWTVHYMAHNYTGQVLPPGITFEDGYKLDFYLHGNGRRAYCEDLIVPRINKLQADVFMILLDTFMTYDWLLRYNFSPAMSVFYFPSDGEFFPLNCQLILQHVTCPVSMSRFGQRQVKELFGLNVDYIPHGVDHNLYRPLSPREREHARAEMKVLSIEGTLMKGFLSGKFVVGVVARNQGRKMLDRTVKAFALFCKERPEAVLYLHLDPEDAAAPFNICQLIRELEIENRVCFSPMKYYENFELRDMNKVYNCMDVFFLSTSGEGFGVPTIEAMSCEVPVIATDYTTTKELLIEDGVCGVAVPLATEITGSWNVDRACIDIQKAAEALVSLYDDAALRLSLGVTGREKVLRFYSWEVVLPQWKKLFERLLS